jgi:hypothetical protein
MQIFTLECDVCQGRGDGPYIDVDVCGPCPECGGRGVFEKYEDEFSCQNCQDYGTVPRGWDVIACPVCRADEIPATTFDEELEAASERL